MSGSTVFLGSKKEFFEKQNQRRVVISGHGLRLTIDKKITVPSGITLYFYCLDGAFTADTLGQAIEGFTGTGNIPQPLETVKSGKSVWNYRLTSHPSPHSARARNLPNSPLPTSISANRCISGSSRCSGMFGISS